MAKSLLNGVNEILKKTDSLDEGSLLSTLTDSARQGYIDTAVQSLNEVVDRLYALPETPKPNQMAEATITLVTSDQDYALDANLIRLFDDYDFIDETNNQIITILSGPDGYRKIVLGDIEQDDTGLPTFGAIRPTDGEFFLDRAPTSDFNGRIYKYRFEQEWSLDTAADIFPFSDPVFRAVVMAASELWMKLNHREFSSSFFNASLAQAAARLSQLPRRHSWAPASFEPNPTDPMPG